MKDVYCIVWVSYSPELTLSGDNLYILYKGQHYVYKGPLGSGLGLENFPFGDGVCFLVSFGVHIKVLKSPCGSGVVSWTFLLVMGYVSWYPW